MEVNEGKNNKILVAVYEMMGQALFIYCIMVSHANALAVVVGLFSAIIIFGGYTGGHFNPAVTLGVLVAGRKFTDVFFALMIIVGQFVGAAIGVGLAFLSIYETEGDKLLPEGHVPVLCPMDDDDGGALLKTEACDNTDGAGFQFNI